MNLTTLVSGLSFSEAPRWHDGRLYYSDFYRNVVEAVDMAGNVEMIATVENQPSGLGWLPDGRLLIVSMLDQKLLIQDLDGSLREYADLSGVATYHCNDMVVDAKGRAYVGNFGSDIETQPANLTPAKLAMVDENGAVTVAAEDLAFPNGAVITPDGKTLIIGETFAQNLTAFDIDDKGILSNRRVWADLGRHFPDGICLDSEMGIWLADPVRNCVIRVVEGGEVTQKIETGKPAYACVLGSEDRTRLFICTAEASGRAAQKSLSGRIEYVDVAIAGAANP